MKQEEFNYFIILQAILKQSPKCFRSLRLNKDNPIHFQNNIFTIIFTWILMLTVITYIFSSSLLLSHIKFKPVKLVESLKDILGNPNLNVAGRFSINTVFAKSVPGLLKRAKKYEKDMEIGNKSLNPNIDFITKNILEDMIKGKAVVLVNSLVKMKIQDSYRDYNLVSAEKKYYNRYLVHLVSKNQKYTAKITNA